MDFKGKTGPLLEALSLRSLTGRWQQRAASPPTAALI